MTVPTKPPAYTHRSTAMTPRRWAIWALLVIGALIMAFPVYWILVTALTPGGQSRSGEFYLWPTEPTLDNFTEAFAAQPVGQWIGNSLVIAAIGTAITVVVALLAGYAFAKFEFRGRNLLFGAFLVTIVIPAQVTLVPSFLVVVNLRLVDTIWAVILPRAADAIAIFIARQFMLKIPNALLEAARIDGAGELTIFLRVVLPLSGPLVGVLVIHELHGEVERLPVAADHVAGHGEPHPPGGAEHHAEQRDLRVAMGADHGDRLPVDAAAADRLPAIPAHVRTGHHEHRNEVRSATPP